MSHPVERKIAALRRRVRRLVLLYAVSGVTAAGLLAVLALGLADYLLRFEDTGIRIISSLAVLAVVGWACSRFLVAALRVRLGDVVLAQRIERRFPGLNDRLASTVQFLRQSEDDRAAGSAALRRAVISQTTAEVEQLDLDEVVDRRPAVRAGLVAMSVVAIVALFVLAAPEMSRIAVARLVNPLGNDAWPRKNHLRLREAVTRVAQGEPLELAVVDVRGAALPRDVRLRIRYESGADQVSEEVAPMQFAGGAMVYQQESVTRPFVYRAEGGDSQPTPWVRLEVVAPPAVESLAVKLIPPAYTGWPEEVADKHFRALRGTRVELTGRSTKPLRAAALTLENGAEIPARLTDEGLGFEIPGPGGEEFVVDQSGSYAFRLVDLEGFEGGSQVRYEVRAVADLPPAVAIEEPASSIFVTADAVVPLRIAAKDDLALRDVGLVYLRSDQSEQGDVAVPLYAGPERAAALALRQSPGTGGENRVVEHRWNLAELALKPGTQLTFHATASDYQPAVGQSQPYRITIITPEELAERIAHRQTFILGELARVLKMQQEARSQVRSVEIQLGDVGHLAKRDIDQLQGAELTQRQVERSLVDGGEGVAAHIQGLLDDLKNNKVDSADVERRMQGLLDEIRRIESEHLGAIEREMTNVIKGAQAKLAEAARAGQAEQAAGAELAPSLATAGREQDEVIASLEQLLGELSQWDNYRRFHREISELRGEQEAIAEQTAELGRQTLTRDLKDLTPQQQADLKKLGQQQQDLARRFDKVQQQMEQMAGELEKTDPLAAGVLEDALHQARQAGISGQMRQGAQGIEQNQVGQAAARQQQAAEGLREMLDILANRTEHELARLVKKLREAEQELADLRARQEGLRKKMEEAAANPDEAERRRELQRLARQQRELQDEAERFARKLQRLQAEQASRSASRAGAKMGQAGQQGEQGDGGQAGQSAAAAEQDLDEAQQQLAERRRQAEMDLAIEQLAKIEDALKSMHQRQQEVIAETQRLDEIRTSEGRWTRGQALSVRDLARNEELLREETASLAKKLDAAEVFALALGGAAREMQRAAELLVRQETGADTQTAEQNALRRLQQLLDALQPEPPEPGEEEQGDQQGGQGGGQPPGDGIPPLAQLKLLKLMQQEVHERTKALEQTFRGAGELTPAQSAEYEALSGEQTVLADLVLNLSQPEEQAPEEDLDSLPQPGGEQPGEKQEEDGGLDANLLDELLK